MENYVVSLRNCPLFENIRPEDLTGMLGCLDARKMWVKKGQFILREGDSTRLVGIVLSGAAQVIREDYYGNRSIISNITPSEVFGEAFACSGIETVPVTITANEASFVMLIDCNRILYTCANGCDFHRQLIFNLMTDLVNKVLLFHKKTEIISKRTTREKLMTYLMITAKELKSSNFSIPFNRQELADYLGVERSGLSLEISKLIKEGVINSHKNHFELL